MLLLQVGAETFRLCRQLVDGVVLVDNAAISAAIKDVYNETRSILEPAGAVGVAGAQAWIKQHGYKVWLVLGHAGVTLPAVWMPLLCVHMCASMVLCLPRGACVSAAEPGDHAMSQHCGQCGVDRCLLRFNSLLLQRPNPAGTCCAAIVMDDVPLVAS